MDLVVIGSDEVFSLEAGCNMMMYGHGVNAKAIVSYAPSFGQTDIGTIKTFNCWELIESGLKKFNYISVRDEKSAVTVETLIGVKPQIVCDPVMLYDFTNTKVDVKLPKKPYLLIYAYSRNFATPDEYEGIKQYAKSKGLITVSAGTYHKWCDKNIICDPIRWLEYFRNAAETVTDTFHGAILSIIFNKPSAYVVRELNANKLSYLLNSMSLNERIIKKTGFDELKTVLSQVTDFTIVNERWLRLRKISEDYLNKCLAEGNV
jgi:hypothetical protein